jgi:hypothetical protein
VHLAIEIAGDDLKLEAVSVDEAGHSRGAAWADPLAALAEGKILEGLGKALHATAPAAWSGTAGDLVFDAVVRELTGGDAFIRVSGDLTATPAVPEAPSSDPAKKPKPGR